MLVLCTFWRSQPFTNVLVIEGVALNRLEIISPRSPTNNHYPKESDQRLAHKRFGLTAHYIHIIPFNYINYRNKHNNSYNREQSIQYHLMVHGGRRKRHEFKDTSESKQSHKEKYYNLLQHSHFTSPKSRDRIRYPVTTVFFTLLANGNPTNQTSDSKT